MTLDEHEWSVSRRRRGDQGRRRWVVEQRYGQRLVLLRRDASELVSADSTGGLARASRSARHCEPPVPVDVEDSEDLVRLECRSLPDDVVGETVEQPFAPHEPSVLVKESASGVVLFPVGEHRAGEHVVGDTVLVQQRAQPAIPAVRFELPLEELGDHFVLRHFPGESHRSEGTARGRR